MSPLNFHVLASEESAIGMIWLRQRELLSEPGTVVTEIMLDHALLMSSCNSVSEQALAQRALELHPGNDLEVLVGGLGLGYTAQAVLRSPRVARLEVVEFLSPVISWLDEGLVPLAAELSGDLRLAVRQGDVYAELAAPPEKVYDLILIDVDHSPEERLGDGNEGFYASEGLERAKQHLAPGGMLGVWSYAESPRFSEALGAVFHDVHIEPLPFRNRQIDEDEINWLFFARD